MGKNVAVFVDVANIFYAAKAAGVDIDYVTLLKSATAGRDFVRAYAYTGLDPDNENQRNFHAFLRRSNYKVVSKDIRKYGDGKVKANLDIELVVDMMKTARNLDIAIVVSGDGDFAPAIRAVQEMGVRVEVISFRGNTSSDLIEVADLFTDITQLARVEKGLALRPPGRRRRRGPVDDRGPRQADRGHRRRRGRGRGRGRGRAGEAEPVAARAAAAAGPGRSLRGRRRGVERAAGGRGLVALPGERLSRAAGRADRGRPGRRRGLHPRRRRARAVEAVRRRRAAEWRGSATATAAGAAAGRPRPRSRSRSRRGRGGRGRRAVGRRADRRPRDAGRTIEAARGSSRTIESPPPRSPADDAVRVGLGLAARDARPAARPAPFAPLTDDEDFDEPEIPEYLIAEQRRGAASRGGRRWRRRCPRRTRRLPSAIERERYGRGGGGGGINRYPDVSGRTPRPPASARTGRRPRTPAVERWRRSPGRTGPAARSASEWSEVPPELEAHARAPSSPASRPPRGRPETGARDSRDRRTERRRAGPEADGRRRKPARTEGGRRPAAPRRGRRGPQPPARPNAGRPAREAGERPEGRPRPHAADDADAAEAEGERRKPAAAKAATADAAARDRCAAERAGATKPRARRARRPTA